uniref:Uncharacterized protein n=1 Tax=Arundo donax TaxID=35708 RepID=A0A0A9CB95_ARUDO
MSHHRIALFAATAIIIIICIPWY